MRTGVLITILLTIPPAAFALVAAVPAAPGLTAPGSIAGYVYRDAGGAPTLESGPDRIGAFTYSLRQRDTLISRELRCSLLWQPDGGWSAPPVAIGATHRRHLSAGRFVPRSNAMYGFA